MPGTLELHRFTGLLGIGFGLIHALVLLGEDYMNYTLGQLLIPFMGSNYRPEWVGFGQMAFYMHLVVAYSYYVRNRLGTHAWRAIHMLSFALFLMVLIHGVKSGTDTGTAWAQGIYWFSGASVLLGSVYRIMAVRRGRPRAQAVATGMLAVGGKTQVPSRLQGAASGSSFGPYRQVPVLTPRYNRLPDSR
jgi:predicted ferric reductase